MSERLDFLYANRGTIKAIAMRHKALSIAVFGSVARGEDGPESDFDFLVKAGPNFSLFDQVRLRRELMEFLKAEVDLVDEGGLYPRDNHIREEALAL
jgi:predicted nucleotidyltransferase